MDDESLTDLTKARVLVLKIMANRCAAYADLDKAEDLAAPIFKVLWQILETRDTIGNVQHSPPAASRLRLRATHCVLKLARHPKFEKEILQGQNFRMMAWMAQVSRSFASRQLRKLTGRNRILATKSGRDTSSS